MIVCCFSSARLRMIVHSVFETVAPWAIANFGATEICSTEILLNPLLGIGVAAS